MTAQYFDPDMTLPLDLEGRLARCPEAEAKGLLFADIAERSRRVGRPVGRDRYIVFRGYALSEWIAFLPEAARALHPGASPREGIRRLGQGTYDRFLDSTIGAVLFGGLADRTLDLAIPLAPRAYEVLGSHGRVSVLERSRGRTVIAMRGFWDWVDAYHVGVFEGALRAFGASAPRVRIRSLSELDADLELTWY